MPEPNLINEAAVSTEAADDAQAGIIPAERFVASRGLRIAGALTLLLAAGWCAMATWVALVYIRNLELAAGMNYYFSLALSGKSPDISFHPAVPVITRLAWLAIMWLVGLWSALSGLLAVLARPTGPRVLRATGFLVVLATAATLAGIQTLTRWGGFYSLPAYTIALICTCQVLPGILLLAIIPKRPKPASGRRRRNATPTASSFLSGRPICQKKGDPDHFLDACFIYGAGLP